MKRLLFGIFFLSSSLAYADQLRFLRDDRDALQARVDVIQAARKEIQAEYFSVWNDNQSIGGMGLLIDAAKRGVKVHVIVDALSNTIPKRTFAALIALGGKNLEVKAYNPLSANLFLATHRDHAKMLIADAETIITGGRNVGDKYFGINRKRNFTDLDIMGKGNVAASAKENFFITWNSAFVKDINIGKYEFVKLHDKACNFERLKKKEEVCDSVSKRTLRKLEKEKQRILGILKEIQTDESDDIVTSNSGIDWFKNSYEIENVKFHSHDPERLVSKKSADFNQDLLKAIEGATTDVNIVSPYLIPTKNLVAAFEKLIANKVRIRIITNSLNSTDNLFAQTGYREIKLKMIAMGIELFEYKGPDTIHAKTAVIDHRFALVGTYNIDPRSAFLNREIGVIADDVNDVGLARDLSQIIEGFRSNSVLISKDGQLLHEDEYKDLPEKKKFLIKMIQIILPLIRNQL